MQTSYYSVVQYVPDPVAGERINIGVIGFEEAGPIFVRLLHDWRRVSRFGADVRSLQIAVSDVIENLSSVAATPGFSGVKQFTELASLWRHSVQLTAPIGAAMDLDELLSEVEGMMLKQPEIKPREEGRLQIARKTASTFRVALRPLEESIGHDLIRQRAPIIGEYTSHQVDVVVGNGTPFLLAQAVSFRKTSGATLRREVDGTAFLVDDILRTRSAPNLAVIMGSPITDARPEYRRAEDLFKRMNARVIPEGSLRRFAGQMATEMAEAVK